MIVCLCMQDEGVSQGDLLGDVSEEYFGDLAGSLKRSTSHTPPVSCSLEILPRMWL